MQSMAFLTGHGQIRLDRLGGVAWSEYEVLVGEIYHLNRNVGWVVNTLWSSSEEAVTTVARKRRDSKAA